MVIQFEETTTKVHFFMKETMNEKHIKILPLCPFAKSVFDKVSEFNDVLSL